MPCQYQVRRFACDCKNSFHHAIAIRGDRSAERAQPLSECLSGGSDNTGTAHQRHLNSGESDCCSRTVDENGMSRTHSQDFNVAKCCFDGQRHCSGLNGIEAGWPMCPVIQDREIRRPRHRRTSEIGCPQNLIANRDILNTFTDGVDGPGDIEPDAAWEIPCEQSPAESPVCRVETAGMDAHTDAFGAGAWEFCFFQSQHVRRFSIVVESNCSRPDRPGLSNAHHQPPESAIWRIESTLHWP